MTALAPLLVTFMLVGVTYTTISVNNNSDTDNKVTTVKQIVLDNIAMSALDLAKQAIKDGAYETTTIFYVNNQDVGYKYLRSKTLNKTLNNIKFSELISSGAEDTILNLAYKRVDNKIMVLINANKNNKDIFLGATFIVGTNGDLLPLAYAGSGTIIGGNMCTMSYDYTNKTVGAIINPDFNFYLDTNFYATPAFTIPNSAPNIKDLQVHSKTNVTVQGYKTIDKVYAQGNVSLTSGATVKEAYAGGTVTTSSGASASVKVSGAQYEYPNINTSFIDNTYNFTNDGTKENITCGVNACKILTDLQSASCPVPNNPYNSNLTYKNAWLYGYNTANNINDCSTTYATISYVDATNPYSFNPEKPAWLYGYTNSTGVCSQYSSVNYANLTSATSVYLDYAATSGDIVFQWQNPYHEERRKVTTSAPHYGPDDEKRLWMYKFNNPTTSCTSYITSEANLTQNVQYPNIKSTTVYNNSGSIKTTAYTNKYHLNRLGYIWGAQNPTGSCQTKYDSYMTTNSGANKYGSIENKTYWSYESSFFTQACDEGQANLKWCSNADTFYNNTYLTSQTTNTLPKNTTELACEKGQNDYINRTQNFTDNATSLKCKEGFNSKQTYNSCVTNTTNTGSCIDTNNLTLADGNYDNLIIGNNCNLTLTGSNYTFTNIDVNNNANINFTNNNVQFKANNIDFKNNSTLNYTGTNSDSYMIISSNLMSMDNNSGLKCTDPRQCLIDTNVFNGSNNSFVQGSLLGRKSINLLNGATIYGNMIGETVDTTNATICNVLDSNGNQMMGNTYFDIVAGNNLVSNKIVSYLSQVLCESYTDCIAKLNSQNVN